jgi:hypothetical protein
VPLLKIPYPKKRFFESIHSEICLASSSAFLETEEKALSDFALRMDRIKKLKPGM